MWKSNIWRNHHPTSSSHVLETFFKNIPPTTSIKDYVSIWKMTAAILLGSFFTKLRQLSLGSPREHIWLHSAVKHPGPYQLWIVGLSHSVVSDALWPCGLQPPGSSVHGISQARILVQISSVQSLSLTLCDPTDCSMPGFPVHHRLPELAQTQVHWVGDAIQSSHPLSPRSPVFPGIRVFCSESVIHIRQPKYWFQFQHQSLQWIFRTDF